MSGTVKKAISLMEMLPESGQNFALEFIRKLVAAWDPDFTKVTPAERNALEKAEKDMKENGTSPFGGVSASPSMPALICCFVGLSKDSIYFTAFFAYPILSLSIFYFVYYSRFLLCNTRERTAWKQNALSGV